MVIVMLVGAIFGFVVAALLLGMVQIAVARRLAARYEGRLRRYDESILDLRQERTEDKETNRKLRRDLIANRPERLIESVTMAERERDSAISERDQAIEQLDLVQRDLSLADGQIKDRETKLREYHRALHEIRVSLESQDSVLGVVTADVSADAVGRSHPRDLSAMPDGPAPSDVSDAVSAPERADASALE